MTVSNAYLRVEIDSGDAAVVDSPYEELAIILEKVAKKLRSEPEDGSTPIFDSNGNRVGRWNLQIDRDGDEEE